MLFVHPHGYSISENLISHSIRGESWELVQNISIPGSRSVKIDYYFIARKSDIREVQLSLSHYHWYFSKIKRSHTGFSAAVGENLDRKDIDQGVTTPNTYRVALESNTAGHLSGPEAIKIGYNDLRGVSNVVTDYKIRRPQRDILTLVASETVSWRPLGNDGRAPDASGGAANTAAGDAT
jgi:hypothetical protein